jgi:hypothetical protein
MLDNLVSNAVTESTRDVGTTVTVALPLAIVPARELVEHAA